MLTIAIRCKKFQLVSGTNHFGGFVFKFVFQVLPIITVLCIIVLFINGPHNIKHRTTTSWIFFSVWLSARQKLSLNI